MVRLVNAGIQQEGARSDSDEESEEGRVDEFERYMPDDMAINLEKQRLFSEECMKRSGDFGRF